LIHDFLYEGKHEVIWDGSSQNGRLVNPGIYFVELFGESVHEAIKIIVE